jgi:hypothetical protein
MSEARRRGEKAEYEELVRSYEKAREEAQRRAIRAIGDEPTPDTDVALARMFVKLSEEGETKKDYGAKRKQLAPMLGMVAAGGPSEDGSWASFGSVSRVGVVVKVHGVTFRDPMDGSRAMCEWLERKGCRSLRYDVEDRGGYGEED